jgi:hypothetical protein
MSNGFVPGCSITRTQAYTGIRPLKSYTNFCLNAVFITFAWLILGNTEKGQWNNFSKNRLIKQ